MSDPLTRIADALEKIAAGSAQKSKSREPQVLSPESTTNTSQKDVKDSPDTAKVLLKRVYFWILREAEWKEEGAPLPSDLRDDIEVFFTNEVK